MENDEKELKEMEIPLKRKKNKRERKSATKSDVDF